MTTAYATKRSLWHLCAKFVKVPAMRETDFIKLSPDAFLLRWHDARGNHRADYRYWAGKPTLHVATEDVRGGMESVSYYPDAGLVSSLGMKKVST